MTIIGERCVQSYSPGNVIAWVGLTLVSQWDSITVTRDKPRWRIVEGMYGQIARSRIDSNLATITIVVPQTSTSNAYLALTEELTSGDMHVDTVVPVVISDLWGGSLHVMTKATIMKQPSISYGKDPKSRTWVFRGNLDLNAQNAGNIVQDAIG